MKINIVMNIKAAKQSLNLPPPEHFEYFSHLFHGQNLIPQSEYTPSENCNYPELEYKRFEKMFLTDPSYYQNCRVLDLGCHTGYLSYIAKYLGAKSIHGINARLFPLEVGRYAFSQLGIDNYIFDQGNIEDLNFLKSVCKDKDTLILTQTLEHLRNPYAILEIISNSDIKNIILESAVFSDEGDPVVKYYKQSSDSAFTVFDNDRTEAVGAIPNVPWFDMVLYHLGWKIDYHTIEHTFNKNWFAIPNLTKFTPQTHKSLTIMCKKFNSNTGPDNFEN